MQSPSPPELCLPPFRALTKTKHTVESPSPPKKANLHAFSSPSPPPPSHPSYIFHFESTTLNNKSTKKPAWLSGRACTVTSNDKVISSILIVGNDSVEEGLVGVLFAAKGLGEELGGRGEFRALVVCVCRVCGQPSGCLLEIRVFCCDPGPHIIYVFQTLAASFIPFALSSSLSLTSSAPNTTTSFSH